MKFVLLVFGVIIASFMVTGQLNIFGDDNEEILNLESIDEVVTFDNNSGSVNSSDFWDNLDTPSDIAESIFWYNHTLALLNLDIWVNETGDTMTGQLTVQSGNGRIISTNAAGAIVAETSGGDPGYISFGNTADVGISTDGVEGTWDSDGAFVFKQKGSNPDGLAEFVFIEEGGDWRFALPKSGADYGTYNPRSLIVAGPSLNNDSNVQCSLWGFDRLDCDTGGTGADLGVQDDLQVLGVSYLDDLHSNDWTNLTGTSHTWSTNQVYSNDITVNGDIYGGNNLTINNTIKSECVESEYVLRMDDNGQTPQNAWYTISGAVESSANYGIFIPTNSTIKTITYGSKGLVAAGFDVTSVFVSGTFVTNVTLPALTYFNTTSVLDYDVDIGDWISWYHKGTAVSAVEDTTLTILLKRRCL